jgi:hypothetical protein
MLDAASRQWAGKSPIEGHAIATVVMLAVVSVDGYLADDNDDVGPLGLGLVDEVAMDVVPVVFGTGKRYFGPVDGQHLLEDPHVVIRGDRMLHLRYRVRR